MSGSNNNSLSSSGVSEGVEPLPPDPDPIVVAVMKQIIQLAYNLRCISVNDQVSTKLQSPRNDMRCINNSMADTTPTVSCTTLESTSTVDTPTATPIAQKGKVDEPDMELPIIDLLANAGTLFDDGPFVRLVTQSNATLVHLGQLMGTVCHQSAFLLRNVVSFDPTRVQLHVMADLKQADILSLTEAKSRRQLHDRKNQTPKSNGFDGRHVQVSERLETIAAKVYPASGKKDHPHGPLLTTPGFVIIHVKYIQEFGIIGEETVLGSLPSYILKYRPKGLTFMHNSIHHSPAHMHPKSLPNPVKDSIKVPIFDSHKPLMSSTSLLEGLQEKPDRIKGHTDSSLTDVKTVMKRRRRKSSSSGRPNAPTEDKCASKYVRRVQWAQSATMQKKSQFGEIIKQADKLSTAETTAVLQTDKAKKCKQTSRRKVLSSHNNRIRGIAEMVVEDQAIVSIQFKPKNKFPSRHKQVGDKLVQQQQQQYHHHQQQQPHRCQKRSHGCQTST